MPVWIGPEVQALPRQAELIEVAAAALVRPDGRVLIMRRLPGTAMAGQWEFPGGKLERGEDAPTALARELDEELGIAPVQARPLIRIRHEYPARSVRLDCARVDAWRGEVAAREGHPLAWVLPDEIASFDMLAADRPIVAALRLPTRYAVTADLPVARMLDEIERLIDAGYPMIQLRAPSLGAHFAKIAATAVARCRTRGTTLLLNGDASIARAVDADGVHLSAARLRTLSERPLPADRWVGASCHDARELAHARAIGCDFAVVGPVARTASHPDAAPLGWDAFAALADCAGMPVYAIGGLRPDEAPTAWVHHGQGVAGISAW